MFHVLLKAFDCCIDSPVIFLVLLIRFPIKRLSSPKQQSQEKRATKPVTENPPPQTTRGRLAKKKQDEEEEEKEEDKEEVLSQSLKKRDKNIQENKAMVTNSYVLLYVLIKCVRHFFDSGFLC